MISVISDLPILKEEKKQRTNCEAICELKFSFFPTVWRGGAPTPEEQKV